MNASPARAALAAGSLWWRELVRFSRQLSRLVGALLTPLLFWLLIGSGIGTSFRPEGGMAGRSYLEYFFPGAMVLILLFTAIFSTITVIEDRREGFLQSVLVAPVPRSSLVAGKVLGGTTLALLQGLLFLAVAPLAGLHPSLAGAAGAAGAALMIAFWLTALGFCIAWTVDSIQGFHVMMNLFLIPMWLLSGALYPPSGSSIWVQWLMRVNPLAYGMAAVRRCLGGAALAGGEGLPSMPVSLGVTAALCVLGFGAAVVLARRAGRSAT